MYIYIVEDWCGDSFRFKGFYKSKRKALNKIKTLEKYGNCYRIYLRKVWLTI